MTEQDLKTKYDSYVSEKVSGFEYFLAQAFFGILILILGGGWLLMDYLLPFKQEVWGFLGVLFIGGIYWVSSDILFRFVIFIYKKIFCKSFETWSREYLYRQDLLKKHNN